jgi:hypothetical protein
MGLETNKDDVCGHEQGTICGDELGKSQNQHASHHMSSWFLHFNDQKLGEL